MVHPPCGGVSFVLSESGRRSWRRRDKAPGTWYSTGGGGGRRLYMRVPFCCLDMEALRVSFYRLDNMEAIRVYFSLSRYGGSSGTFFVSVWRLYEYLFLVSIGRRWTKGRE